MVGMTVAELVARLRADTSDFTRGMRGAESTLSHLDGVSSKSMNGLRRLGETFNQMASVAAVSGATTVASLAAVGVSYNTLMQKTTAAFNVLLGSAGKSQAMVQELTDFARNSPFPRQLFIQGAQQLIGFGMAAKNVVPAFEAIQDAVAAVGGGSEEIATFTQIFARIKSLGRANSEELMRFSMVGIDAFKLLADQAGVSVTEIRKRISDGGLLADETISLLTAGLTAQFDGAAAQVKETWVGAVDRVKGAWRDIGSALMAPFIDPQGGGAAVKWANQLADLLRRLESRAVGPLAKKMKEFFDTVSQMTDEVDFDQWIDRGIALWERYGDVIKQLLPIIGAVSVGFAQQGLAMVPVVGQFANFLPIPGKITLALVGLLASTDEGRESLQRIAETLKSGLSTLLPALLPLVGDLAENLADLLVPLVDIGVAVLEMGLPVLASGLGAAMQMASALASAITPLAELLADHPSLISAVVAGYAAWKAVGFATSILKWAEGLTILTTATTANTVATQAATVAGAQLAASNSAAAVSSLYATSRFAGLSAALTKFSTAARGAMTFMTGLGGAATLGLGIGINAAVSILGNAADAANEFKAATADGLAFDIKTESLDDWRRKINEIGAEYNALKSEGESSNIRQFGQELNPFADNSIRESAEAAAALEKDLFSAQAAMERAIVTSQQWGNANAMTTSQVEALAKSAGVDLTGSAKDVKVALTDAWKAAGEVGKQSEIMAAGANMTTAAWERQQAAFKAMEHDILPGIHGMTDAAASQATSMEAVAEKVEDSTITAFRNSAVAVQALPETYAETISQIDSQIQSFLSPLSAWGAAQSAVTERISNDHGAFVDEMRSKHEGLMDSYREQWERLDSEGRVPFEEWVETVKGSSTAFDEWSANINGMSLEGFTEGMDIAKESFTEFLGTMDQRIADLASWQDNLRIIGERGGGALAIEIAKWGPEAATLVGQIATATEPEFQRFADQQAAILAASTDNLIMELGLQALIGENGGATTVAGIEKTLGLLPGKVRQVAETAKSDFGLVMDALAIAAEADGEIAATSLAAKLAETLGLKYSTVLNSVNQYKDLFASLGVVIANAGNGLNGSWYMKEITNPDGTKRTVRVGGLAERDGGILSFANGGFGENHIAQIARAGDMRTWAEPETGGEAYIPLAMAKRGRSMSILAEVARRFGASLVPAGSSFSNGGLSFPDIPSEIFGAGARSSGSSGGGTTYKMTVNQARGETTEQSLHRTMREMAYLNDDD